MSTINYRIAINVSTAPNYLNIPNTPNNDLNNSCPNIHRFPYTICPTTSKVIIVARNDTASAPGVLVVEDEVSAPVMTQIPSSL